MGSFYHRSSLGSGAQPAEGSLGKAQDIDELTVGSRLAQHSDPAGDLKAGQQDKAKGGAACRQQPGQFGKDGKDHDVDSYLCDGFQGISDGEVQRLRQRSAAGGRRHPPAAYGEFPGIRADGKAYDDRGHKEDGQGREL